MRGNQIKFKWRKQNSTWKFLFPYEKNMRHFSLSLCLSKTTFLWVIDYRLEIELWTWSYIVCTSVHKKGWMDVEDVGVYILSGHICCVIRCIVDYMDGRKYLKHEAIDRFNGGKAHLLDYGSLTGKGIKRESTTTYRTFLYSTFSPLPSPFPCK